MPHDAVNRIFRFIDGDTVEDYLDGRPLRSGDPITVEINGNLIDEAFFAFCDSDNQRWFHIEDAFFPIDEDTTVYRRYDWRPRLRS